MGDGLWSQKIIYKQNPIHQKRKHRKKQQLHYFPPEYLFVRCILNNKNQIVLRIVKEYLSHHKSIVTIVNETSANPVKIVQIKSLSPVQYSTVQYSTVQYCTVQYSTVQYSTVQYSTVQYSTVQYSTVQYSTVQYSTVQYSTIQ